MTIRTVVGDIADVGVTAINTDAIIERVAQGDSRQDRQPIIAQRVKSRRVERNLGVTEFKPGNDIDMVFAEAENITYPAGNVPKIQLSIDPQIVISPEGAAAGVKNKIPNFKGIV